MRNRIVLSVLLLLVASGLTWAQFWKGYSDTERKSLAEAYWLAGSQYQAAGLSEKGAEFQAVARSMYPELDPASIADQALPSAAELLAQGRTRIIGGTSETVRAAPVETAPTPEAVPDVDSIITGTFSEFLTAILSKDADAAVRKVSANVEFLRLRQTVTKDELRTSLQGYFDNADFASTDLSDSLDVSSIFVEPVDSPVAGVSGPVYALNVRSTLDLSAGIPFWASYMKFFFSQEGGSWLIFAVM